MVEPTQQQRSQINGLMGDVALAQFMKIEEQTKFSRYRLAALAAIKAAGGMRTHDCRVDQILAGGELPYQVISVDRFRSGRDLLTAYDSVESERRSALSDAYSLLIRPRSYIPNLAKSLGVLAPILSRWLGTKNEKEMAGFSEHANPETGPIPETIEVMREHDQSTPFYMMNLNKYYLHARYENGDDATGEQAYNRYASRIMPYLISVGGYPSIIGPIIAVFVGDKSNPLHDAWSEFAMVYYPSRRNFIRMMSNSPTRGVYHREAGLQRAVLMPGTSISNGD